MRSPRRLPLVLLVALQFVGVARATIGPTLQSQLGNPSGATAVATQVGAFTFAAGSADAAMIVTLAPGNYTAQVAGVGATTGLALVEVYELP